MHRYKCFNAPMATTATMQPVTTSGSTKTMLQIATPSTRQFQIISWGFSLSATSAVSGTIDLVSTNVAATVTAHVAAGLQPLDPNAPASLMTVGSSTGSGYTASAEGTPTVTRSLDTVVAVSGSGTDEFIYEYQFMPDERPIVPISNFLRIRSGLTTTTPMLCWVCWDE